MSQVRVSCRSEVQSKFSPTKRRVRFPFTGSQRKTWPLVRPTFNQTRGRSVKCPMLKLSLSSIKEYHWTWSFIDSGVVWHRTRVTYLITKNLVPWIRFEDNSDYGGNFQRNGSSLCSRTGTMCLLYFRVREYKNRNRETRNINFIEVGVSRFPGREGSDRIMRQMVSGRL